MLWCCSQQLTKVKRFSIICLCHLRAKVNIKEILLWQSWGVCSEASTRFVIGSLGFILVFSLPCSSGTASNGMLFFAFMCFLLHLPPACLHFACLEFSLSKQYSTQQLKGSNRKWEIRFWVPTGSLFYRNFAWISVEMDVFQFPLKQNEKDKPLIHMFFSSKEAVHLSGFFRTM